LPIFLDLEYESWQGLDIDVSAVDCRDFEAFGETLVKELEHYAKAFICSSLTPRLTSIEFRYPTFKQGIYPKHDIVRYFIER
jgi:hypothetical protein